MPDVIQKNNPKMKRRAAANCRVRKWRAYSRCSDTTSCLASVTQPISHCYQNRGGKQKDERTSGLAQVRRRGAEVQRCRGIRIRVKDGCLASYGGLRPEEETKRSWPYLRRVHRIGGRRRQRLHYYGYGRRRATAQLLQL